jgi:hypothetical protein
MGHSLTMRVLSRVEQAESRESNPHFQDDYRIAWITVLRASRGERMPHVSATYAVLGLHPDKVWPAIVERRKSLLGADYSKFFPAAEQRLPAKKPAQSVSLDEGTRPRAA